MTHGQKGAFIVIIGLASYHYIVVCVCEVTGNHSTVTKKKNVLFLCKAAAGRYFREPTDTASNASHIS